MTNETTPDQIARALKPCPFCGSPGEMIHPMGHWRPGGYGPNGSCIRCSNIDCSCCGIACYGDDQDAKAITAWNQRDTLSPPTEAEAQPGAVRDVLNGVVLEGQRPPFLHAPTFADREETRVCINGCLFIRADKAGGYVDAVLASLPPKAAERAAVVAFIAFVADMSDEVASQAGVGGMETAGAIISYLAKHPEKLDSFMEEGFFALPVDMYAHGALSWHAMNGKITTPEHARRARIVKDLEKSK